MMTGFSLLSWLMLAVASGPVDTRFAQVAPVPENRAGVERSAGQNRAVVLFSGLYLHLILESEVPRATFAAWQLSGSPLVEALSRQADVFSFAYGQSVPITAIARLPDFTTMIDRLRQAGYAEIVLVGHSAGGLVARQFVEDHPDAGVTKVVQVCAPNMGSGWADLKDAVRPTQKPFVESLTKAARTRWLKQRPDVTLPKHVQFVCIIATGIGHGDGVVSVPSQWSDDLQNQGVPGFVVFGAHGLIPGSRSGIDLIGQAMRENQARWEAAKVDELRRHLRD